MPQVNKDFTEKVIINKFVKAYAMECGIYLEDISSRERPDFETTIKESGEKVGIEVTGLYQNQREAMINYGKIPEWDTFTGSLNELVSALNTRLEKKAALSYDYEFEGRMLLAIWVGSIVFNQPFDFKFIVDQIEVPSSRFDQTWLVLEDEECETALMLLAPARDTDNETS